MRMKYNMRLELTKEESDLLNRLLIAYDPIGNERAWFDLVITTVIDNKKITDVDWQRPPEKEIELANFSKLVISRMAFDEAPQEKKELLKYLKAKTIAQEISLDKGEIIWYFVPDTFVEVITKYPWLLDSNLGERSL